MALAAPDAWRLLATAITAHVAKIGNIPRPANSARRNLGAIVEPLRTHAVHAYAGRLQRLSVDGDGLDARVEACVERAGDVAARGAEGRSAAAAAADATGGVNRVGLRRGAVQRGAWRRREIGDEPRQRNEDGSDSRAQGPR